MGTHPKAEYKLRQQELRRLNRLVSKHEAWKVKGNEKQVARSQEVRQHPVKVQTGGSNPSAPAIIPFRLPQKIG